jgi:hypothetical protein
MLLLRFTLFRGIVVKFSDFFAGTYGLSSHVCGVALNSESLGFEIDYNVPLDESRDFALHEVIVGGFFDLKACHKNVPSSNRARLEL